ncbi:hypothetical protein PTQ21_12280 [Paenibacillus marchantiae]|uniref:hypothetical protein n=1 Tax=Paenibacillus marchantiae TaxID=3026433 RepID=UPI00237A797D|nr:hypothetical protein [Paenibacillus marchantiae]WDQ34966.1 hypothetical protein PTQ21_12280 [Paenibacillus marchantiae]
MVKIDKVADFFTEVDVITGFGGVILGFLLTEVIGFFRRKSESKTRFIESNYIYRQQAYSDSILHSLNSENILQVLLFQMEMNSPKEENMRSLVP